MKSLILAYTFLVSPVLVTGQSMEETIRNLDNQEHQAVLNGDTVSLFQKFWSPDMVINTPANRVGTVEATKELVRSGRLSYEKFERTVEKISIIGDIAVVMGQESLLPAGETAHAGKKVERRFTNVWMKQQDGWRMIARQATIISIQ